MLGQKRWQVLNYGPLFKEKPLSVLTNNFMAELPTYLNRIQGRKSKYRLGETKSKSIWHLPIANRVSIVLIAAEQID